jgi:hypothetical protein
VKVDVIVVNTTPAALACSARDQGREPLTMSFDNAEYCWLPGCAAEMIHAGILDRPATSLKMTLERERNLFKTGRHVSDASSSPTTL